jgi:hypothetical protein
MSITSWFMRIDRYASVHAVRSQDTVVKGGKDSSNSCGIASILMVNFKQKKHLMAAGLSAGAAISSSGVPLGTYIGGQLSQMAIDQAVKEEPEIYKIYSDVTGSAYDGSTYSIAGQFPEVLRRLGLGSWERVFVPETDVYSACKTAVDKGDPVIARIAWNNGGAHFVVIDQVHTNGTGGKLCVCDPWDAELRLVDGANASVVNYDPNAFVWSFSLGGNRHEYTKPNPGKFSGCIVRKT